MRINFGHLTFIVLFWFTMSLWASSPDGSPPQNAKEAIAKSDVVFLGKVKNVAKDKLDFPSLAEVRVQKVWKGKDLLPKSVRIDGSGGPTYPARLFKTNATYLFYLPVIEKATVLRADSCLHRVLIESEAKEDLRYLAHISGQGKK